MLARIALWTAAAAILATLVLGALDVFGVGLSARTPLPQDVSQRILHRFLAAEESFLLWGRWEDVALGIGFGSLLLAVPALASNAGERIVLAAGAALSVIGAAIYLSKLAGFETARLGLDNGLGDTFAAASVFRFAINTTASYVWTAGMFLLAIGFVPKILGLANRTERLLSAIVAAALVVAGTAHVIAGDLAGIVFNTSFTVFAVAFVAWVAVISPRIRSEGPVALAA